ncbi:DNA-binding transcriptional MerR regulator [Crossiella equi]|uniref:DNA-binding transcriptional MerR regulator n=1 Tax=Crossiella equi TaxID=130796 RepID=A0ABS5A7F1_9PSEU|nr:MerR family transcriptional regulator [Crossiella equi]MBP2472522.1 DNA-binding transcriptional MerR regulator [Crossiella equi]
MIPISEFSHLCHLSPQTLRYYHAEGLLVPNEVDEQTGYRSYTFDQVEQAMLVTVLRGTGMSVKAVRAALDEPDTARELLRQHTEEVRRQREAQDHAISDAQALLAVWPDPVRRHVPAMTVVSGVVPGPSEWQGQYDWAEADAALGTAVEEVVRAVRAAGGEVAGAPWRTPALETRGQRQGNLTTDGPHWLVKVPVTTADLRLPGELEVQEFPARDELAVFIPGRSSMAKYGTALARLLAFPLTDAYPDVARVRQVLLADGLETAVTVYPMDEQDLAG